MGGGDTLDDAIDDVREAATNLLNSDGRSVGHVLLGAAATAGFALLVTALATRAVTPQRAPSHPSRRQSPVAERSRGALSLILPAVFSATTLSALRVWNAPSQPGRSRTLGLWALAQGVNALWLAARPSSLGGQMAAAMSSAGLAAAFANQARRLDEAAGRMTAPTGLGVRLANRIERRIDATHPTLH